jgi:hypothetical protein
MIGRGGEAGGGRKVWQGIIGSHFLGKIADMVGGCGARGTILHPARIVSCTSLSFLMRGFRRKVAWILMERSSWVHLEAFLNLRHVR